MDTAELYVGNNHVFSGATFERLPVVGEYVSYLNNWHLVQQVGHSWGGGGLGNPVCNITLDPNHNVAGPGPFPWGHGASMPPKTD